CRTVACVGRVDKTVTLWETATGEQRGELTGHQEMVFDLAYSPDGRTVATASMDGTVRLWDALSLQELGRLEGHRGWVLTAACAPAGRGRCGGGRPTTAVAGDVRRFTKRPAKPAALAAAALEAGWEDLGPGAARAYGGRAKLRAAPAGAVAFLGERMKPAAA